MASPKSTGPATGWRNIHKGRNAAALALQLIARDAGDLLLAHRLRGVHAVTKPDGSPVTEADLAAEALILARLAVEFPGCPIISEENAASHHALEADAFLLVDPLDGTRGYIGGGDDFCVLIALIEGGVPVAGALDAPAWGRSFRAGEQAFETADRQKPEGALIDILPARAGAAIGVASKLHGADEGEALCRTLGAIAVLHENSALKFARLARGEADIYPRPGRVMQWDIAAGDALLRAAGGSVTTMDGTPVRYGFGADGWSAPPFIARRRALAG